MENLEQRFCPHCHHQLEEWIGPPETGWGILLVCQNNDCHFFRGSADDILHKGEDSKNLGCRYAENPDNGYKPLNLLAVCIR